LLHCYVPTYQFLYNFLYTGTVLEVFEDTPGAIRSSKSKKDRQYNGQKKKNKRTNIDLQNTTQKTKD